MIDAFKTERVFAWNRGRTSLAARVLLTCSQIVPGAGRIQCKLGGKVNNTKKKSASDRTLIFKIKCKFILLVWNLTPYQIEAAVLVGSGNDQNSSKPESDLLT